MDMPKYYMTRSCTSNDCNINSDDFHPAVSQSRSAPPPIQVKSVSQSVKSVSQSVSRSVSLSIRQSVNTIVGKKCATPIAERLAVNI